MELLSVEPKDFETVSSALKGMGCQIDCRSNSVTLVSDGRLKAGRPILTRPYPGFPTDAQPLLMAASLKAEGTTVFVENIFENRYRQVPELRRLGADIRVEGRVAMVTGVPEPRRAGKCHRPEGRRFLLTVACPPQGSLVFDGSRIDGVMSLMAALSLGADIRRARNHYCT